MQISEEIITGCKEGIASCQEKLYAFYSRRMMAVCMRYTSSRCEAEDVFHEAFVKVFKQLKSYEGGSFEGWMRRVFVNTAINHFHSNRKYQEQLDYSSIEESLPAEDNVLDVISGQELMQLINLMPPGYKLIFNLFEIEGYSHREISERLNISEGTSRSQLAKAKMHLKKILQKHSISKAC